MHVFNLNLCKAAASVLQKSIPNAVAKCKFSVHSAENEVVVQRLGGIQTGITVLGLNRPDAKNAFSRSLVETFFDILSELKHDNGSRVVILRSTTPGIFCAGADLKERKNMSQDDVSAFVSNLRQLLVSIEQLPMPVIAALDGTALGGGLEMALACDMRTAADNTKMGLVETKLAIIPGAGGTQRLPRILSPSLAKELIFTGRVFNGKEAKEMGIVNHVVTQNEAMDAAYQKAVQLAEEILPNGPVGVRMAKLAIDKGIQVDLNTGYSIEEVCYSQVIPTKDRLEGLQAFAEKRKPVYKGDKFRMSDNSVAELKDKYKNKYQWRPADIIDEPYKIGKGHVCLVLNRDVKIPPHVVKKLWQNANARCCVDGGSNRWRQFLMLNKKIECELEPPDMITGDFDSITEETKQYFKSTKTRYIRTPDQNATDFTKAVNLVKPLLDENGIQDIIVFHESSGRFDQIMANINTLYKFEQQFFNIYLLSGNSMTWLLKPGKHSITIPSDLVQNQRWCSLIPIGQEAANVSTTGLKWNLDNHSLKFGGMVSSSNTYSLSSVEIETCEPLIWSMGIFDFSDY